MEEKAKDKIKNILLKGIDTKNKLRGELKTSIQLLSKSRVRVEKRWLE